MTVTHCPARVALTAAITGLLVLSSLYLLVSIAAPAMGDPANEVAQQGPSSTYTRLLPDWSGIRWDWTQYADPSGRVSAIIADEDLASLSMLESTHPEQVGTEFAQSFTGFTVRMPLADLENMLAADPTVQAYPDIVMSASLATSVGAIGADQMWSTLDGNGDQVKGLGVVVAVIDTGVDYTHPDLGGGFGPGHKVIGGYDFYNKDANPMDDNGHGTHVAGIIAANGGIVGVAPQSSILAYKALGADGTGEMSLVIKAIEAAMDPNGDGSTSDHADVISMSLGGPGESDDPVCLAVESATAAGVVVVAAAGNSGPGTNTVASPGLAPDAITVGAVDDSGVLATFSSRGPTPDLSIKPEVSAPGVGIDSTVPYSNAAHSSLSGHMAMSGTSMATPHVSGAAALLLQQHPDWTPAQVKSALVLGAKSISRSVWAAGAGEIWVPSSASMDVFATRPVVSLGLAGTNHVLISVYNSRSTSVSLNIVPEDRFALAANGSESADVWTNLSYVAQSSLTIPALGSGQVDLSVSQPTAASPEGYYDGWIVLHDGARDLRVPFGFVVLSKLSVHVYDLSGTEVFDPYGGVWAFSIPDAGTVLSRRGNSQPAPPAEFLLPSGTYCVVASGHQLVNDYSDPYMLSKTVTVGMLASENVTLYMSTANRMNVDLATPAGHPIYVKDFRMYLRYVGTDRNISFDITGSDYSVRGADIFSLVKSRTVLVSDIQARVGISLAGFSYSPDMWDFMERNADHWYEWISGASTEFYPEATADLQYLLSWEFEGVTSSSSTQLSVDPQRSHYYITKYDIPGVIADAWNNWGDHRSIGGDSSFFVRRDTDTSVNNFFSGMNRTTIVQGPFTELYFQEGLFNGYVERQYYQPDPSHLIRADTVTEIFVPDRAWLTEVGSGVSYDRLGSGPFYASVRLATSSDRFTLYHPLLRDSNDARVGGATQPSMRLYKDGMLVGIYQLSEHLARPDAQRVVALAGAGSYKAQIEYHPLEQIYDNVTIALGFTPGLADPDPPTMTGMEISQKFVPGQGVGISFAGSDRSGLTASLAWRPSASSSWTELSLASAGQGKFSSTIQTMTGTASISIKIRLMDTSGNYMEYVVDHAAIPQTPVTFSLVPSVTDVDYRAGDFTVPLSGYLKSASGRPLSDLSGVPIELWVGTRKVGMILDEDVSTGSHTHNGDISFDWVLDPTRIFTGQGQSVLVTAKFDLGTYQTSTSSFTLQATESSDLPPVLTSTSLSGSLIRAGTPVTLEARDDGTVTGVTYSVDGGGVMNLALTPVAPGVWTGDISTSSWTEGPHTVSASATDDVGLQSAALVLSLQVDRNPPVITLNITNGQAVPLGWTFDVKATDSHLSAMSWQVDSGAVHWKNGTATSAMDRVNTSGLPIGGHVVKVTARDTVGHRSWQNATFTVSDSSVVVSLVSPLPDSQGAIFIKPGVQLNLSVIGDGEVSCSWVEYGTLHNLAKPYSISTAGWSDGAHEILVTAFNEFGKSDILTISLTVDGTGPTISMTPADGSLMSPNSTVQIDVYDANFDSLVWTAFGVAVQTQNPSPHLIVGVHGEGSFTVGVTAVDRAGNAASKLLNYVLDVAAPKITFNPILNFTAGSSVNISGTATDTISQLTVVLNYERSDHTFAQMTMALNGSSYATTLPSSLLWDGMRVYVTATDAVGHISVTPMKVINASVPPVGPPPPGDGNDTNQSNPPPVTPPSKKDNPHRQHKKLFSLSGSLAVSQESFAACTLAAFTVPAFVAVSRRRRQSDDEGEIESALHPHYVSPFPYHGGEDVEAPVSFVGIGEELRDAFSELVTEERDPFIAALPPVSVTAATLDIEEEKDEEAQVAPAIPEEPKQRRIRRILEKQAKAPVDIEELLPSVPKEVVTASQEPDQRKEPEIDYGALIERELNIDVRKRSALDIELDEFFAEKHAEVDQNAPVLASGLKLKALMEEERRKRHSD